jgi:hypothetical protein
VRQRIQVEVVARLFVATLIASRSGGRRGDLGGEPLP